MPRYIALEWDTSQARVAVARVGGREVVVEDAFTVEIAPRTPETAADEIDVGQWLASELSARKLTSLDALVTIGRGDVELRMLTLPPAPDDELPELVRFQAQSHFSALGDDWALDFLPVSGDQHQQRHVLAAGMSPLAMTRIGQACESAQLRPRRFVLGSCAAASLLHRESGQAAGVRLTVDLLPVGSDLTVLMDGAVVFMRSVRLPGERNSAEHAEALAGEIRRTMTAAHNHLSNRRVEEVILFGVPAHDEPVRSGLQHAIDLPVRLCDPFDCVPLGEKLRVQRPDPSGFAPLLGALLDEAGERRHAIDFLHPRKKPQPPSRRRLVIGVAAAVAAIVLVIAGIVGWQILGQESEITSLEKQSAALDERVAVAKANAAKVDKIDNWARNEVIWIRVLAELSQRFPEPEAARVSRFVAGTRREGGGELVLDGLVDSQNTIADLENAIRDDVHRVIGSGGQYDDADADYPWRFKERILLNVLDPIDRPETVLAAPASGADESQSPSPPPPTSPSTEVEDAASSRRPKP